MDDFKGADDKAADDKGAWAEVDKEAVRENIAYVRSLLPEGTRFCAVLKGNAYGHDLVKMKDYLVSASLVDMVAVGQVSELLLLQDHPHPKDVDELLLGFCRAREVEVALGEGRLSAQKMVFSIYNLPQFLELEELAKKSGKVLRVHLRVDPQDSGMGLSFETMLWQEEVFFSSPHVKVTGLYAHFYSSYGEDDSKLQRELEGFDAFLSRLSKKHLEGLIIHACNSPLVFRTAGHAYSMVRVGSALYGIQGGFEDRAPKDRTRELHTAMRICARVFAIKTIQKQTSLSYHPSGAQDMRRIARLMIGYWDVPLLLNQKDVRVCIRGKLFPLADDVCMDNLCIDITGSEEVSVGDVAYLLGPVGVRLEDILERNEIEFLHAEWLTMTAGRLPKVYV